MADKLRGGSTAGGALIYTTDNLDRNNIEGTLDTTGNITAPAFVGSLTGNSSTASKWATARTLTTTLTGAVTGTASMSVDGSGNKTVTVATTATSDPKLTLSGDATGNATFTNLGDATLSVTVKDDSHNHSNSSITSLDGSKITSGTISNDRLPSSISSDITGNAATATNADKLDNISSGSFLRSDANDSASGDLTFNGRVNIRGHIDLSDNEYLYFGSGDDVEFFCNGSHMYTDLNSGIGNWYIRDGSTTRFTFDDAGHFTATGTINGNLFSGSGASLTSLNASNISSGTIADARLPGSISSSITGNSATATKWATARSLTTTLTGAVTGTASMSVDGSGNKTVTVTTTATSDPTLTLAGDASGSATFTNLGNATLTVAVANDSHTHAFNNLTSKSSGTGTYKTSGSFEAPLITTKTITAQNTGQLILNAGESGNYATGQEASGLTNENVFINAELGVQINSTPDNWDSGWAGRNTATICASDGTSTFPATVTAPTFSGALSGNASTATKWKTARTITLGGDASGSVSIDGSANKTLTVTVANNSHNHTTLTGITSLGFAANSSDSASITTTVSGSSTFFDFNLTDDNNSDYWRWRFTPSGSTVYNAMILKPVSNGNADLTVSGKVTSDSFVGSGASLTSLNASNISSGTINDARLPSSITSSITGNAATATKWATARSLTTTLTGDVSGTASMSVDGSGDETTTITAVVANDSHTHAFNNLTGKTSGTGDYATTGNIISGKSSGGVALTINDGYGNANVTFNHAKGVPEQNGNSARIVHNADATTDSNLDFQLKSNVTANTAVTTTSVCTIYETGLLLKDNKYLMLGGSKSAPDAELFSNGSHLYLDLNSTIGNFYIRDGSTTRYTFDDNGSFTATGDISGDDITSTTGNVNLTSASSVQYNDTTDSIDFVFA